MRGTRQSSQDLDDALKAALRLLRRRRIPYMVIGGLALSVWGRVRVTQDVDIAVALEEEAEADLVRALRRAHFLPAAPRAMVGHKLLVCRYLKTAKGLPVEVDLFFVHGAYQRQAIRRAVTVRFGGQSLRIISPEDLILYKLLADRPMDRLDIQTILEEQRGRLDRRYLRRWAKPLGITTKKLVLI
ncbi:MAG: nucleotidyltransferase [Candidatus Omnitrophica bacterium]|nr:nucleotidyltransferase [Candidatus Omnitrophota bacterium]